MSREVGGERVRTVGLVTREFRGLQGYKLIPWALPMLLWWGSEAGVLRGNWWTWAFSASVLLAGLTSWLVAGWYARNYGQVRPHRWARSRHAAIATLVVLGVWALIAALGAWGLWPADLTQHPWSLPGMVFGGALVLAGWRWRKVTASVWMFGIVLLVASAAPIGMLPPFDGHPFNTEGAAMGLLALFVIVVGVASHRALDRVMGPPPEDDGASAPRTDRA